MPMNKKNIHISQKLTDFSVLVEVFIVDYTGEPSMREILQGMGLRPGVKIVLIRKSHSDLLLQCGNTKIALGNALAENFLVRTSS